MKINKICVITDNYPTNNDPIYSFLDEVVCKIVDFGIECTVICPVSIFERKHKYKTRERITQKGNRIKILCPRYFSFSKIERFHLQTWKLTFKVIANVINRTFIKEVKDCDVIYAHFLKNAICASKLAKKFNKHIYVSCGESEFYVERNIYKYFNEEIKKITGIIAVSTKVKEDMINQNLIPNNKNVLVLPNGVDLNKFNRIDKNECRKALNIPLDKFIVIFVGAFTDRKGIKQVIKSVNDLDDVYGVFIGGETLPVECDKALLVSKVSHDELNVYLNSADVFVLPTENEGCCNAIIEAQACGLPIITSDLSFNYDILDKDSALLINPKNNDEIKRSIVSIKNNKMLSEQLSKKSLEWSNKRDINIRVNRIIDFINGSEEKYDSK